MSGRGGVSPHTHERTVTPHTPSPVGWVRLGPARRAAGLYGIGQPQAAAGGVGGRSLCERETDIAEEFEEATVVFVYLDGYAELARRHGGAAALSWLNAGDTRQPDHV